MQTTFPVTIVSIPEQAAAPRPEPRTIPAPHHSPNIPVPAAPAEAALSAVPRSEAVVVPTREKHVYCVVSRLMTNTVYVSGGFERPQLASQPTNMTVVIGDTRYCIHFRSLKGGFPEYLEDPNLMRMAQDSAAKLMQRRFASASGSQA